MIVLVLSLIFGWATGIKDVQRAFLCGNFKKEQKIYITVLSIWMADDFVAKKLWFKGGCKCIIC
jgi:hypothetical protein